MCIHVFVCVCIYVHMHVCMCIYVHMYAYICIPILPVGKIPPSHLDLLSQLFLDNFNTSFDHDGL